MAIIGYARTSAADQVAGFDVQIRHLEATGRTRLYREHVSTTANRDQLAATLDYVGEGDVFMVGGPDRLARSTADLLSTVRQLEVKQVGLIVLSMGDHPLDTRTPIGKLMLTMLGAVAGTLLRGSFGTWVNTSAQRYYMVPSL